MKLRITLLIFVLTLSLQSWSQITITGYVTDGLTGTAISQARVEAASVYVLTDAEGRFTVPVAEPGNFTLIITIDGYEKASFPVSVTKESADAGKISLTPTVSTAESGLSEIVLSGESDDKDQAVSGLLHSTADVFTNTASYTFSSMFFRMRGYESEFDKVYIEGIPINDEESGRAVYSEWGGLNDVFRNREYLNGIEPGMFSIGSLGGTTNFTTRASKQRKQTKFSYALSNRSYTNRIMFTHSTGMMKNNWAFSVSGSRRWGNEGFVEGTSYDGYAYFIGAEKKINSRHRLALTAYASPTRRGMSSSSVQEVYDLLDNNYYNANWGYQDGEKRNARVRSTNEPMFILSHYWTLDDKTSITTSAAFTSGTTGTTSLNWYNARDPRPDYYRNLPNYQPYANVPVDPVISAIIADNWRNDVNTRQINWARLYQVNQLSKMEGKQAQYIVENNITATQQWYMTSRISKATGEYGNFSGGLELTHYKGSHYKELDDLLGGSHWVDIDQFSQRDFQSDTIKLQNDLNNPNRIIKEGDKFGYDYALYSNNVTLWGLEQLTFPKYDAYVGFSITGYQYWRDGQMKNGRDTLTSFGKSEVNSNIYFSFKSGVTYKISGRHFVTVNGAFMSRPPVLRDAYISPRTTAKMTPGISDLYIFSGDVSYILRYPNFNARVTLFETAFDGYTEILRFYDEGLLTFVNMSMTKEKRIHQGVELGTEAKLRSFLSLIGVVSYGNYRYTNRPIGTRYVDNGTVPDTSETIYAKNYYVGGSPQFASSLGLKFNKNYWFVNLNANYYDKIWLDFNPLRRTFSAVTMLAENDPARAGILKQTQLDGGVTLDLSIGKSIRIKNYFINLNFSVSNLLDNQKLISGGYEQARVDLIPSNLNPIYTRMGSVEKFPPKYYYAYGRTYFLNVGFRF